MATVELEIPSLAPGDNLTRGEFLRIWELHPDIKRAELIGGIVYMPSPVAFEHGYRESDVGGWLMYYRTYTLVCASAHNATMLMLEDSPQPDLNLHILPEYGGLSRYDGLYLAGAAEFLAEICRSSVAYDLHQKLELYQEAGVQEFLAVLIREKEIRWHVLQNGTYELLQPGPDGVWRSRVFPGLWLDGKALLAGDMARVLTRLQEGINSPEHQAFVQALAARKEILQQGKSP